MVRSDFMKKESLAEKWLKDYLAGKFGKVYHEPMPELERLSLIAQRDLIRKYPETRLFPGRPNPSDEYYNKAIKALDQIIARKRSKNPLKSKGTV